MNANEKRAEEVVAACSRASYEGIDPRSVILIALASAERRGEDRVLRWIARFGGNYIPGGGFTSMIEAYRKARRRARGSK